MERTYCIGQLAKLTLTDNEAAQACSPITLDGNPTPMLIDKSAEAILKNRHRLDLKMRSINGQISAVGSIFRGVCIVDDGPPDHGSAAILIRG
ncbi:hypothetical protein ACE6H2_021140 [Prunus campanulata]